jgi:hypothetical protein
MLLVKSMYVVWPGWANFRLLVDCFLWAYFWKWHMYVQGDQTPNEWLLTLSNYFKIAEIANVLGPLLRLCINFDQKCLGLHFGRFFHKLIWSPCVCSANSWATFCHQTSFVLIWKKTDWATLWAILAQAHLVTLVKRLWLVIGFLITVRKGIFRV